MLMRVQAITPAVEACYDEIEDHELFCSVTHFVVEKHKARKHVAEKLSSSV